MSKVGNLPQRFWYLKAHLFSLDTRKENFMRLLQLLQIPAAFSLRFLGGFDLQLPDFICN